MRIGDDFILGTMPVVYPSRALPVGNEDEFDENSQSRFDELFNTVFAASNSISQELSEAGKESTAKLMTGQLDDLTEHMVTNEKSSIQLELNLAVRNKVLDAYSEIMKTQI